MTVSVLSHNKNTFDLSRVLWNENLNATLPVSPGVFLRVFCTRLAVLEKSLKAHPSDVGNNNNNNNKIEKKNPSDLT